MAKEFVHILLPGHELSRTEILPEETIASFIERTHMDVLRLPTICVIDGLPVLKEAWATTTISSPDRCEFWSKPYGGGNGGKMSSVLGLLGVVALAAIAPWAAGSLFAAGSFGYYATVAAITIGGGLLLSSFLAPKPAAASNTDDNIPQMYTLSASGNVASPLQVIPVQYGKLKWEPPYASIPWSEFIGEDMYLNVALCLGVGKYDVENIYIDDTILWNKNTGLSASFSGVDIQFVQPGESLTLFPSNVISSAEVNGQEVTTTPVGGFVVNNAGTIATAVAFDFVFPAGLFSVDTNPKSKDPSKLLNASVTVVCQLQAVDDAGSPIGSWITVINETITRNNRTPHRVSYKLNTSPGRYMGRVYRTTAPSTGTDVQDSFQWAGFRGFLKGTDTFPNVTVLAIRMLASNQLSQNAAKKFGVLQTRILPVWNGSAFVEQPTRNPLWAFYDCATNSLYGAKQELTKVDFQAVVDGANGASTRGDTFNYVFQSAVTFQAAFDTILASVRSKTAWIGDILSVTRDEWKPIPQMLLTDQQIVRGSLSIDYILNDDSQSDCVTCAFLNEDIWGPAQLQYPPNSGSFVGLNPASIQLEGVTNPDQIYRELQFYYNQANLRRIQVKLDTEHDGRLLRFGSVVRIQSKLPRKWGQSGEVLAYNSLTRVLTLSQDLTFTPATQHYIELRSKTGSVFGPVLAGPISGHPNQCQFDETDLATVEANQGTTVADALDRMDGAEPPSYAFGIESETARTCIVMNGAPQDDKVSLLLTVDSEAVHNVDGSGTPIQPTAPALQDPRVPLIVNLTANFRQGVAEPWLDATWWPAPGAIAYRCQLSYDSGLSWISLPDQQNPTLSTPVSRANLTLRVAAIGTLQGPWSQVSVDAPTITIDVGTVAPSSLQLGLGDYVMKQLSDTRDQVNIVMQNIAAVAADHDAATALNDIVMRQRIQSVAGGAKASIEVLQQTLADTNSALSQYQITVSAQFDDLSAVVTQNSEAIATGTGATAALYTLTLDVNNYISGFQSINDGAFASFTIIADAFQVAAPGSGGGAPVPVFQVLTVNGTAKLALRGDMYADGTITANKLNVSSLSAITANIGTVTAGVIQSSDGQMVINLNSKQFIIYGP